MKEDKDPRQHFSTKTLKERGFEQLEEWKKIKEERLKQKWMNEELTDKEFGDEYEKVLNEYNEEFQEICKMSDKRSASKKW